MEHVVACACGMKISVAETAAGTNVGCAACGRQVAVPSLRELRRLAGVREPTLSPAFIVESMLLKGTLPEGHDCVLCGTHTDGCMVCRTECERAVIKGARPSRWAILLGFLTFGWLGAWIAWAAPQNETEVGTDRVYSLPLRVCPACRPRLKDSKDLLDALCRVPLYRELLVGYPDVVVSLMS